MMQQMVIDRVSVEFFDFFVFVNHTDTFFQGPEFFFCSSGSTMNSALVSLLINGKRSETTKQEQS